MIVASLARRSIHSSRSRPLATFSSTYAASSSLSSSTRRPFGTSVPTMFALTPFRGAPGAVQPKTFSRQDELPRLPIPQLNDTFERYLTTLEPLLRQAEEFGELDAGKTAAEELDKRRAWAREALKPGSLVNRLQQRLIGEWYPARRLLIVLTHRLTSCPSCPIPRRRPDHAQQLA